MSSFFLNFPIEKSKKLISHQHNLTFLGSCFSNEIAKISEEAGFRVLSNPFGTLFHPIPIAKNLRQVLYNQNDYSVLKRDGKFYSWDSSTSISALTEAELVEKIQEQQTHLREKLLGSGFLFVTFGSAFYYLHKESNEVVANCHKQPNYLFLKYLSEVDELFLEWNQIIDDLLAFNPDLNIVFTVSPVRHVKDGIIENNRSKSRLIHLVEKLCENSKVTYFPSYEIIMDELRDYRFFKQDRVHPNEEAINYVWSRFSEMYFDEKTKEIIAEFLQIRRRLAHRSESNSILEEKTIKLKSKLETNFPWVKW